jgi:hypothetical protein
MSQNCSNPEYKSLNLEVPKFLARKDLLEAQASNFRFHFCLKFQGGADVACDFRNIYARDGHAVTVEMDLNSKHGLTIKNDESWDAKIAQKNAIITRRPLHA